MIKHFLYAALVLAFFSACNEAGNNNNSTEMKSTTDTVKTSISGAFEQDINGKSTKLFVLQNENIKAAITNYGGRLVSLWVPDKNGKMTDVVVGFEGVQDYINSTEPYFGATIGRYGNRIAKGKFSIDGAEYISSINNTPNTLHGGKEGFQSRVFDAKQVSDSVLELTYVSPDGEEGFPGNLN